MGKAKHWNISLASYRTAFNDGQVKADKIWAN